MMNVPTYQPMIYEHLVDSLHPVEEDFDILAVAVNIKILFLLLVAIVINERCILSLSSEPSATRG
jgi:hypothetical protein